MPQLPACPVQIPESPPYETRITTSNLPRMPERSIEGTILEHTHRTNTNAPIGNKEKGQVEKVAVELKRCEALVRKFGQGDYGLDA